MTRLVPLRASLIEPGWADRVVSPPHDALTPDQRQEHLAANPDSYLGVTRSAADLAAEDRAAGVDVLARCRSALDRLRRLGAYGPLRGPSLWVYRLTADDHVQTGVVGGIPVDGLAAGGVRTHEQVDGARAGDLADHLDALRVQSSPVALARRADRDLDDLVTEAIDGRPPALDLEHDDLRQQVWEIDDAGSAAGITAGMRDRPLYVIDGHHRAAAAARHLRDNPSAAAGVLLSVVFPAAELRNRAFHRRLAGVDPSYLLDLLSVVFPVREAPLAAGARPDELAVLAGGRWYLVTVPPVAGPATEPAAFAALDAVRLQRAVLEPLLGIDPSAPHPGLSYVPAIGGADTPAGVDPGDHPVLWFCRPVPMDTLLEAADAGLVMPPKSTYFRPKVRSGIFLRPLH